MNQIDAFLHNLRGEPAFISSVASWTKLPAALPRYGELLQPLLPPIKAMLDATGVTQLYQHQAVAINHAFAGENLIIATPTASGKSLCYTIPVLSRLLQNPKGTALYLFPTKALTQDQFVQTTEMIELGELGMQAHRYDGDTPRHLRSQIRRKPGILFTNPDMLHSGILPQHPQWRLFFTQLQYVVIDEIHMYRGVFGSHVANLLRRLQRLCAFYGSDPQFICCSATIANPQEHAEKLVERPFTLIGAEQNGAPRGEKHLILYNPPLVDEQLGLRQSPVLAARDLALELLKWELQGLVFARARQTVELLLSYLREAAEIPDAEKRIAGYRSGYLPLERRQIERGLRDGTVQLVVATNALELGIDIGSLQATILTGYPGSIAATWQQLGRAGRSDDRSVGVLVAGASPLDQYICVTPRYLLGGTPEQALINPDNRHILARHLLCAAFELPFQQDEPFGASEAASELLQLLSAEDGALQPVTRRDQTQYHWLGEGIPSHGVSLRSSSDDRVVIHAVADERPIVIGELERDAVPLMLYEGAVYMHQAESYLVERLDWEEGLAWVRPMALDYYTRASLSVKLQSLHPLVESDRDGIGYGYGHLSLERKATGFRKIKRHTQETLGFGEIDLPPTHLDTDGFWLILEKSFTEQLINGGILLAPNDYGPQWAARRQEVLQRDHYRCQICQADTPNGAGLHVHHIRPFRTFADIADDTERRRQANALENLITVCPSCHLKAESGQQTRSALSGLAYLLRNLAPLFLMCAPTDIGVLAEMRNPITKAPTLIIYEQIPAGVGFSERLFSSRLPLLQAAADRIASCRCHDGCPGCVGPPGEIGPATKGITARLLTALLQRTN